MMPDEREASQAETNLNEMLDEDDEQLTGGAETEKQIEYDMAP